MAIDRLNAAGGGILLLDEIEKADPNLVRALLSFDAPRITMNDGETKDLSKIFVVLTSNLGSAEAARMRSAPYAALRRHILRTAEDFFNPEVLARFSAKIVTNRLPFDVQREIATALVRKELALQSKFLQRDITLSSEDVVRFLVRKGFTAELGARTIRNAVEQHIGQALLPFVYNAPECSGIGDRYSRDLTLVIEEDKLQAVPAYGRSVELHNLAYPAPKTLLKAS